MVPACRGLRNPVNADGEVGLFHPEDVDFLCRTAAARDAHRGVAREEFGDIGRGQRFDLPPQGEDGAAGGLDVILAVADDRDRVEGEGIGAHRLLRVKRCGEGQKRGAGERDKGGGSA